MQRYPGNPQPDAPLPEFRRPIPSAHGAKIRKKLTGPWTSFQNGLNIRTEPEQRRLNGRAGTAFQFLARKANRAFVPFDIFREQEGPV